MKNDVSFAEALRLVLDSLPAAGPGREAVPPEEAAGRVLAAPVRADRDDPSFDASAMDGFCLASADAQKASKEKPARLRIAGATYAGDRPGARLAPGEALRIMTGAPLPGGADAVIPFEDAEAEGGFLLLRAPVPAGRCVTRRGSRVAREALIFKEGHAVRPWETGLLAEFRGGGVLVARRPVAALLASGDELAPPGAAAGEGRIPASNLPLLAALVRDAGGLPEALPLAPDSADAITERLAAAVGADLVLTVGGSSRGERDFVKEALERLGWRPIFSGVRMSPGRPTSFGLLGERPVFCLPGRPEAALAAFILLARPALRRMLGQAKPFPSLVAAELAGPVRGREGAVKAVPAAIAWPGGRAVATPFPEPPAAVDAFILLAPGRRLEKGRLAPVLLLDAAIGAAGLEEFLAGISKDYR